ncbi:hypothetical protein ElyMa_002079300 [Elysia marginata]|uniref:Uncharacterized protein n=1 Tax=Elysia marginata TaxID=1093978 RepID=A0AAV4FCL2_9GAST|nr:hypothetical protein ElyMa_002079300 [Elysia marginata]
MLTCVLFSRNIFCAKCHSEGEKLDEWSGRVKCVGSAGPLVSATHSQEDLYSKLVDPSSVNSSTCELVYGRPSASDLDPAKTRDGTYTRLCNKVSNTLIDTCNASGVTRFRDANIEAACAMYESVFDGIYRNLFCYICNQPFPYSLQYIESIVHWGYPANSARVSFAALLDLSGSDTWAGQAEEALGQEDQCNSTQVFDVVTVSRKVHGESQLGNFETRGNKI